MKCPGCATDMTLKRVITVDIDMCPACSGIVLDKGEPEAIEALGVARVIEGANRDAATATRTPDPLPREQSAHCYECNQDMIALTGAGDIEYDWCTGCERLFFDKGELSALDAFKAE